MAVPGRTPPPDREPSTEFGDEPKKKQKSIASNLSPGGVSCVAGASHCYDTATRFETVNGLHFCSRSVAGKTAWRQEANAQKGRSIQSSCVRVANSGAACIHDYRWLYLYRELVVLQVH